MKKYFIMINTHQHIPVVMTNEDDEVALFNTYKQALNAASLNDLCKACGFIIYEWDEQRAIGNF